MSYVTKDHLLTLTPIAIGAQIAKQTFMPSGKKRKRKKMNTHKRKKRLRKNRHKKKGR
jgi:hypothetical protein